MQEFHRIRRLPPYVFEQVNRAKAKARNNGADIIDLGMGNPDLPAPAHVVEKLKDTIGKPRTDRYSVSRGILGLRRAQAAYYQRRFGVKLDPDTQIVATSGSKEGFANVAQAIIGPGDVVLVPNPSYPIHAFGFLMAGGVIRSVPSEPTPAFFDVLERAVVHSIPRPIAVVVCYPANPTAYVAELEFYRDLVAFAKRHGIFILSDLAYSEVYFENQPPPSVLQVPGAVDVTVEFTSLSKTYSMPGTEGRAHGRPVIGLGDIHHRNVAGDAAMHAATPPVGVLDLDLARIDHPAHHRDMAQAHAAVGAERQSRCRLGNAAAGIDARRVVPPLPGVAGDRRCRNRCVRTARRRCRRPRNSGRAATPAVRRRSQRGRLGGVSTRYCGGLSWLSSGRGAGGRCGDLTTLRLRN